MDMVGCADVALDKGRFGSVFNAHREPWMHSRIGTCRDEKHFDRHVHAHPLIDVHMHSISQERGIQFDKRVFASWGKRRPVTHFAVFVQQGSQITDAHAFGQ